MTRVLCLAAMALLALGGTFSPAAAQQPPAPALPDPEQAGRFRLGPVRFTPSITLSNIGVDSNVFNELEDPKRDTTAVFGPKVEFWTRFGPRALVYGASSLDYHYFQRYESQRSLGTTNIARVDVDLGRLMPFADGTYTRTRVRPGFEIDARALRTESSGRAGLGLRIGSRTRLDFWGRRATFRYDASEEFLGTNLAQALNRDAETAGATLHVALTPLTTFVLENEVQRDRFVLSPDRDADTVRITPGFTFKPFALVDGRLLIGYRRFETLDPLLPDYAGLTAAIDLGYSLRATRIVGRFDRDVTYSFETTEPYYLSTDLAFDVTQKITRGWDVVGRVGRFTLDYSVVRVPGQIERVDRGVTWGAGVGYRLGELVRIGFDVDRIERRSDLAARTYDGYRMGLSATYGIKQR